MTAIRSIAVALLMLLGLEQAAPAWNQPGVPPTRLLGSISAIDGNTATITSREGTSNGLEVLVFPEAARGSNEGHYPWDLQPEGQWLAIVAS